MNAETALKACASLMRSSARRWRKRSRYGFEVAELEQVGAIGVLKALRRYDPERGAIQAYASIWIDRELREFVQRFGSPLSAMRDCGMKRPAELARDALRRERRAAAFVDADECGQDGADHGARLDAGRAVASLRRRFSERDARIVLECAVGDKTFAEAGGDVGVSRQRAQQVYARAVEWMRKGC